MEGEIGEPNFELVPSRLPEVIPRLMEAPLGFAGSPEHASLIGSADDLPGVIASNYAAYVVRQEREGAPPKRLKELMEPLREFASWNDSEVSALLQDSVLEQFRADGASEDLWSELAARMEKLLR